MLFLFLFLSILCGFVLGYVYRWRGFPYIGKWKTPFTGTRKEYAIGISHGMKIDDFQQNSVLVLSRHDVTDVNANFLADPFLIKRNSNWYMFMEVFNRSQSRGEIGLATSKNGMEWTYQAIVLRESFHLSYPYVFEHEQEIWMIPETGKDNSVRLYRSVEFPRKWTLEKKLLEGKAYTDASIFQHKGFFWMFVSCNNSHDLLLYFSEDLMKPWKMHPRSPIVYSEPQKARCAGRVVNLNGDIIRFAQDCKNEYGRVVRAFCIEHLDLYEYRETQLENSPILFGSGTGWNETGMHHIDMHALPDKSYLAVVDGMKRVRDFGLKY